MSESDLSLGQVPKTIRCLLKQDATESYVLKDILTPTTEGGEVLIRVDAVGLCGSDICLYKWDDTARVIASIPFTPGHECTGRVVACGEQTTLRVGQRIAVENHFFCGKCYLCEQDRGDICRQMGQYGVGNKTPHGGCSQYSIVPEIYCYPLTTNISIEEATMLEPLGVSHNAIENLEVDGENVLIIGCGPIGLMACSVAKALGATRVLAADVNEERLTLARTMGADILINPSKVDIKEVIDQQTNNVGIGRICEMSGNDVMIRTMWCLLCKGGHIVMVGLPKKPVVVENPLQNLVFKSLTLRTIHGRRIFHTWREIEKLLAEKKVDVTPVISHRIPMSRYQDAFKVLLSGEACKIIMDPQA